MKAADALFASSSCDAAGRRARRTAIFRTVPPRCMALHCSAIQPARYARQAILSTCSIMPPDPAPAHEPAIRPQSLMNYASRRMLTPDAHQGRSRLWNDAGCSGCRQSAAVASGCGRHCGSKHRGSVHACRRRGQSRGSATAAAYSPEAKESGMPETNTSWPASARPGTGVRTLSTGPVMRSALSSIP